MLALETQARWLRALPALARIGLMVLVLGGLADAAAHTAPHVAPDAAPIAAADAARAAAPEAAPIAAIPVPVPVPGEAAGHDHAFAPAEAWSHVVVVAGMALILLGVVIDGARRARPGRPAGTTTKGGT